MILEENKNLYNFFLFSGSWVTLNDDTESLMQTSVSLCSPQYAFNCFTNAIWASVVNGGVAHTVELQLSPGPSKWPNNSPLYTCDQSYWKSLHHENVLRLLIKLCKVVQWAYLRITCTLSVVYGHHTYTGHRTWKMKIRLPKERTWTFLFKLCVQISPNGACTE